MSFKRNIIASYVSQIYTAAIGIVMLPFYIRYMGAEAYGMIGFFTMLQAWFALLDLGLTPTIGRETARFNAGALDTISFRQLYRSLSCIFIGVAVSGAALLLWQASNIALHWLNVKLLPLGEVVVALKIIAVCVSLRWLGGLYRGVITGFERLVWLSGFNLIIGTFRFVIVIPVMSYFGYSIQVFFSYQVVVAICECVCLWLKSVTLLPKLSALQNASIGWSFKPVRPVLKFALSIAFTSSVWVLVTQTDKLVLSSILSLSDYGVYTLAVLVSSGIMIIGAPISTVLMPRMAHLYASGHKVEVIALYKSSTQLVSVIAGAAAITLILCANELLTVWTGNVEIAQKAAPILQLYAIGNGLLAIGAFPYYLQYARGELFYHLLGNALMVILIIPCIILAAKTYGGIGAGVVWCAMNAIYLFCWVAYVHTKLVPGVHVRWLTGDVLRIIVPALCVALLVAYLFPPSADALMNFVKILSVGCSALLVAVLASPFVRAIISTKMMRVKA